MCVSITNNNLFALVNGYPSPLAYAKNVAHYSTMNKYKHKRTTNKLTIPVIAKLRWKYLSVKKKKTK